MEVIQQGQYTFITLQREMQRAKGCFAVTHEGMLYGEEGLHWLDLGRLNGMKTEASIEVKEAIKNKSAIGINLAYQSKEEWLKYFQAAEEKNKKKRVHLLALGDVGGTVLIGLKLLGKDCISQIGIFDVNPLVSQRWEYEMNQTALPWAYDALPEVEIIGEEALFDCDMFVFCASKGIPPVGSEVKDVRMVQFDANRGIISRFAKKAREANFQGLFAVVSDPVDPLCKAAFLASNEDEKGNFDGKGLRPEQVQGFGLGVMNARAAYYAKKEKRFASFLAEGRAFGPHGEDLVIANSVEHYDDQISKELTKLAVEANLRTREMGFKPYIAPALSSAALSLILTLEGKWHYSSNFLGGIYMGCKNRSTKVGLEIESLTLPDALYGRLQKAYDGLEAIL